MPGGRRKAIPPDSQVQLRQRRDRLPHNRPERAAPVSATAALYGVSPTSVYRALHRFLQPHSAHRADYGKSARLAAGRSRALLRIDGDLVTRSNASSGMGLSASDRPIEMTVSIYTGAW
ncbi:hypothetical protein B0G81_7688 [Paraburkholderia sp. BL6665CI2N2]|nr:hypothetical protein B0G81_7688 [Paraburkholderia sp. BL6665CI2N2]